MFFTNVSMGYPGSRFSFPQVSRATRGVLTRRTHRPPIFASRASWVKRWGASSPSPRVCSCGLVSPRSGQTYLSVETALAGRPVGFDLLWLGDRAVFEQLAQPLNRLRASGQRERLAPALESTCSLSPGRARFTSPRSFARRKCGESSTTPTVVSRIPNSPTTPRTRFVANVLMRFAVEHSGAVMRRCLHRTSHEVTAETRSPRERAPKGRALDRLIPSP